MWFRCADPVESIHNLRVPGVLFMTDSEEQEEHLPIIQFPALADQADLPDWLGTTAVDLQVLMDSVPTLYEQRTRKKRGGGVRVVYALPRQLPMPRQLRAIQRTIARSIVAAHTFPPCVYGVADHPRRPTPGVRRSIVNNARQHLGRKQVLRCDLADFFDQIRLSHVRQIFMFLGARGTAVDCLTRLCILDDRIPQGASSSPVLANVAARKLDDDLAAFARRTGCIYTRYVDDLVFSGEVVEAAQVAEVTELVEQNGFILNPAKTRLQRRGRSQYVTGLNVSDPSRTHVPSAFKRRLRSMLRLAAKRGFEDGTRKQLEGMVAYLTATDQGVKRTKRATGELVPTFGDRMVALFKEADARSTASQGKASVSL